MKKKKKGLSILLLIVLLLCITIGFSVLSSTLNILGTTTIGGGTGGWDVHFERIQVTSGGVTPTQAPSINSAGNTITYSVPLTAPGQFFEFTFYVKNDSTVRAQLSEAASLSGVSQEQANYVSYTLFNIDSTGNTSPTAEGQGIRAGGERQYVVRVEIPDTVTQSQLPTEPQTLNLSATMNFVQA